MSIMLAVPLVHCDRKSLVLQSQHILKQKGSTEIYNIQSNCLLVSINTKYSQVSISLVFCTCFAYVSPQQHPPPEEPPLPPIGIAGLEAEC